MSRLDYYDILPDGMKAYLSTYGHHFSKKMCEWAVSKMRDMNGNKVKMRPKEQVDAILKSNNVELKNDYGYDAVFVFHMCLSDFLNSSVIDEGHAASYVSDLLDDVDGYEGIAFDRFIADCNGKGVPIIWSDLI
jgi:hypothetical protein